MPYEILDHTADIKMRVEGETLPVLFSEALKGLYAVLRPKAKRGSKVKRTLGVRSNDTTALLVDFLSEALRLAQTYKEAYSKVVFENFSHASLRAELSGIPAERFGEDVKAVTYHEAEIRKNDAGNYESTLVFDI